MKKRNQSILLGILGVVILLAVVCVGVAAWFFASAFETEAADEGAATRAFDEARQRFGGMTPIIEIRDREMVLLRKPPEQAPQIQTVHVLVWNPDDERLANVALPMWLLRLSDDPIELTAGSDIPAAENLSMTAAEIERYGPSLVIDHQDEDGERILVWTD